eukprot:TRINITY_DN50776_c0_g1_i1.p1 TRINITY_DN50776_c0_g1~~TRINITY_DN50776_c0_g1_i1.p1  ORF type:complete len:221 (+),score=30.11 TRINITY_DN50776_c0_g1_i1:82-663(+)
MADKGMLVLVIGDLHIPQRAANIPKAFKEKLVSGKINTILCTGNLNSKDALDWLRSVCPDVHLVTGDHDDPAVTRDVPDTLTVTIGSFRFGIIHGHQVVPWGDSSALQMWQRKLDCDVLISGHTHVPTAVKSHGRLLLNPGSATGAYSALSPRATPSFFLLHLVDDSMSIFKYSVGADGASELERDEWRKGGL